MVQWALAIINNLFLNGRMKMCYIQGFEWVFTHHRHCFCRQMVYLMIKFTKHKIFFLYLTHIFRKFHWDHLFMTSATASKTIRGQIQNLHSYISLLLWRTRLTKPAFQPQRFHSNNLIDFGKIQMWKRKISLNNHNFTKKMLFS